MKLHPEDSDVCIVGAGVAGAALASFLGNNGLKIAIVEQQLRERDVIVGELLQPGGAQLLDQMGLSDFLQGMDAQPILGYNVVLDDRDNLFPYPAGEAQQHGYGFRNGKFVQNMRNHLRSLPNVSVIEGKVTRLVQRRGTYIGVQYQAKGSSEQSDLSAMLTVVCDGPMSRFRPQLSTPEVRVSSYFLGMILHDVRLPHDNYGHLYIGEHAPFLLYPVNSNEIRILIDLPEMVSPRMQPELRNYLNEQVGSHLPEVLKDPFKAALQKGKYKVMPNHRLPARPKLKDGAILLGDSLNMRHPLTGGGMTAALADVYNLGQRIIHGGDLNSAEVRQSITNSFYQSRHEGSQTINILADALYHVVKNGELRAAFFNYISKRGKYSDEPMALLGGLIRDKSLLVKHFFGVANHGTRSKLIHEKGIEKITSSFHIMKDAIQIIAPLLLTEKKKMPVR